jgi:2-polyprenyl-6-methoxyphenol hydroxylase-like FAD-dependent oxidoreductase
MYDAIIIGARCAGSTTAMLLARQGFKVLLVDRAAFPSDTISTHILWPHGAEILARWGLLGRVAATGAPPICRPMTFDVGPFALRDAIPDANDGMGGFCSRRTLLDSLAVNAAAEVGVEVRENFTVDGSLVGGDVGGGVRGHGIGSPVEERARVVIGADGVNSCVARSVRAPEYDARPVAACAYYSYFSGVRQDDIELYFRDHHAFGGAPTNEGRHLVMVNWPGRDFPVVRADVEGHVWRALESARCSRRRSVRRGRASVRSKTDWQRTRRRATRQRRRHRRLSVGDHWCDSTGGFHVGRESRPHYGCCERCGVSEMNDDVKGVRSCT